MLPPPGLLRARLWGFCRQQRSALSAAKRRLLHAAAAPLPPESLLSRINEAVKARPMAAAIAFAGAKTLAADELVQRFLEQRETVDRRRSAVFLGFGLFQVGWVQYLLYSRYFPMLFPPSPAFTAASIAHKLRDFAGMRNLAKMVCVDQFVYHPLSYFPVFYTFQQLQVWLCQGVGTLAEVPGRVVENYRQNVFSDLKAPPHHHPQPAVC